MMTFDKATNPMTVRTPNVTLRYLILDGSPGFPDVSADIEGLQ